MKRIFSTLCIVVMVGLIATSCKKKNEEVTSMNFTLEEVKGFEADNNDKAYIDVWNGGVMKWNEGDRIMVYNIDYGNYQESVAEEWETYSGSEGQATAGFHGSDVGDLKDMFYYFYPAVSASGNLQDGNRETFTINHVQTYNDKKMANGQPCRFDPTSLVMACIVDNGIVNGSYTLNHIFGFLNLKLNGTYWNGKKVKEIKITDHSWNLYGNLSVKIKQDFNPFTLRDDLMPELIASNGVGQAYTDYLGHLSTYLQGIGYIANGAGKDIILDCSKANNNTGVDATSKYFFISLRPGALYTGFTVEVTLMDKDSNGNNIVVEPMVVGANMSNLIKPGWFTNVTYTLNN